MMSIVIGVRFKKSGKIYYFDPTQLEVEVNQNVIVETSRGVEFGKVVIGKREVPEKELILPLKNVMRIATPDDELTNTENKFKQKEAKKVCSEKIKKHKLEMKLIDVEYTFDNNKVIFYFTADGRVDFRDLVKDLAAVFRTRIELRQIGVRDEAKFVNGIGQCGLPLCCANWLGDFQPVSIRMAKDQNLSLSPNKISGICGRLMCCLKYEHETYMELKKTLPKKGEKVKTENGIGKVVDMDVLKQRVNVLFHSKEEDGDSEVIWFNLDEIEELKPRIQKASNT
jgi:cell fate regulator YaaT (PSP1 superfamily)